MEIRAPPCPWRPAAAIAKDIARRVELRLTDIDIETACEVVRLVAGME